MDSLRLFLLDQGIPVEYELDTFNTPHTGTTLFHPPKLAMLIAMSNSTPAPSDYFTSGQHFFGDNQASSPNDQKHKLTVTPKFISSNGKYDFRYILRTYFPRTSNNTRYYLNIFITPFRLFTSFLSHEACSTNANSIFHANIKRLS